MKNFLVFTLAHYFILIIFGMNVYAQTKNTPVPEIQNPFIPQLPIKPQIVENKQKSIPDNPSNKIIDKSKTGDLKINIPEVLEPKLPPLPQPNFTITGIIWNTDRPQAIINGQVVDIGDVIQDFKIESISPTAIEVSIKGVRMTVKP